MTSSKSGMHNGGNLDKLNKCSLFSLYWDFPQNIWSMIPKRRIRIKVRLGSIMRFWICMHFCTLSSFLMLMILNLTNHYVTNLINSARDPGSSLSQTKALSQFHTGADGTIPKFYRVKGEHHKHASVSKTIIEFACLLYEVRKQSHSSNCKWVYWTMMGYWNAFELMTLNACHVTWAISARHPWGLATQHQRTY